MPDFFTNELFPAFWMALGGLLLGFASLIDFSRPGRWRQGIFWAVSVYALANLILGVGSAVFDPSVPMAVPYLVVCGLHVLFFLVPTRQGTAIIRRLTELVRIPKIRFGALACLGLAASIVTLHWTSSHLPAPLPEDLEEAIPPEQQVVLQEIQDSSVSTDRGRPVLVRTNVFPTAGRLDSESLRRQVAVLANMGLRDQVIHIPSGWQNCNCHGWVFTEGRYWVGGEEVEKILKDNRYRPVDHPKVGDLAVYRSSSNQSVSHTGIVRYLGPNGLVLVESKWGNLGRFIHPHNVHCYVGDPCTFHRSERKSHTLLGLHFHSSDSAAPDSEMLAPFTNSSVETEFSGF